MQPDETPEPATDPGTPPAPEPTPPAQPDTPPPADLGDAGKKALDAERAARKSLERELADLRPLADEARKAAEARKTAEQKLAEKLDAATATATEAQTKLARLEAALAAMPKGFDPADLGKVLKRLTGATSAELEQDAAELFALFAPEAPAATPAQPTGRPVENLRPAGLTPGVEPSLAEQITAAEKAGDIRESMRLKSLQLQQLAGGAT